MPSDLGLHCLHWPVISNTKSENGYIEKQISDNSTENNEIILSKLDGNVSLVVCCPPSSLFCMHISCFDLLPCQT